MPALIIGLGNPGGQYATTRHNIGFMLADHLADIYRASWASKHQGLLCSLSIQGQKVLLLKPQTYMNLSGQSAGEVARYFRIDLADILVLHDELDLPFATLRMKQGGGHAGHNGLKSLDAHLGGREYHRLRLGIDHPGERHLVSNYVLSPFNKAEQAELPDILIQGARAVEGWLQGASRSD